MKSAAKPHWLISLIILSGIFIGNLLLHKSELKKLPSRHHAWAQADYYAIALNFRENNNLFHPRTYNLSKQFKPASGTVKKETYTPGDLQLNPYIAGKLMAVFDTNSVTIFRIINILCYSISIWFVFLISYFYSSSYIVSVIASILALTSVIYIDYASSILPSIGASMWFLAGVYHYYCLKKIGWSMLFFTLAALVRFPFVMPIIALFLNELTFIILARKTKKRSLILIATSLITVMLFFLFKTYQFKIYGSIFLNSPEIIYDITALKSTLVNAFETWSSSVLTRVQKSIFLVLIGVTMVLLFLKKRLFHDRFFSWFLIYAMGVVCYILLMASQFIHHDYYFIDTIYPLFTLGIVLILKTVPRNNYRKFINWGVCLFLLIFHFYQITHSLQERKFENFSFYENQISDIENSQEFLRKYISNFDQTLFLNPKGPNLPLVILKESAISPVYNRNVNAADLFNYWKPKFIVIQNRDVGKSLKDKYPDWLHYSELIKTNGILSILKPIDSYRQIDLFDFYFKGNSESYTRKLFTQENTQELPISSSDNYLMTTSFKPEFTSSVNFLEVTGDVNSSDIQLVIDIQDELDGSHKLTYFPITTHKFRETLFIPKSLSGSMIKVYIYNPKNYSTILNAFTVSQIY